MTWLHTELISTCADSTLFSCSQEIPDPGPDHIPPTMDTIKSVLIDETVSLFTSAGDVARSGAYIYPLKVYPTPTPKHKTKVL